ESRPNSKRNRELRRLREPAGGELATDPSRPYDSPMPPRRRYLRSFEAGSLLETFLVAAVVAILAIRFFLRVTGYPQIGGSRFHIAHMLWGGVLMAAAIIVLLSFLDRAATHLA